MHTLKICIVGGRTFRESPCVVLTSRRTICSRVGRQITPGEPNSSSSTTGDGANIVHIARTGPGLSMSKARSQCGRCGIALCFDSCRQLFPPPLSPAHMSTTSKDLKEGMAHVCVQGDIHGAEGGGSHSQIEGKATERAFHHPTRCSFLPDSPVEGRIYVGRPKWLSVSGPIVNPVRRLMREFTGGGGEERRSFDLK